MLRTAPDRHRDWYPPDVGRFFGDEHRRLDLLCTTEVGAGLLAECVASVHHRHPDLDHDELPGPIPMPQARQYEFTDFGPVLTIAECASALACYEYQSCEHPAWGGSAAREFCGDLLRALAPMLPGYQNAPWELGAEFVLGRAADSATLL
jgi:hypothetical protein